MELASGGWLLNHPFGCFYVTCMWWLVPHIGWRHHICVSPGVSLCFLCSYKLVCARTGSLENMVLSQWNPLVAYMHTPMNGQQRALLLLCTIQRLFFLLKAELQVPHIKNMHSLNFFFVKNNFYIKIPHILFTSRYNTRISSIIQLSFVLTIF